MGFAFSIGGFAEVGTKEVEVGKTHEFNLFEKGSWQISDLLLAKTDLAGGKDTSDLDGISFEWFDGKLLIDNCIIVDGVPVEDNSIGIITSAREPVGTETITVAYLIKTQIPSVRQPPWIDLLSTASRLYWRNQLIAIPPILISAYDNHTARQLERTLISNGKSISEIETFFGDHYRWKGQAKEGLECLTGTRLPEEIPQTYTKLAELRNKRDDYIIHIDADDDLAQVSARDALDMMSTVSEAILTVHKLCYDARNH